MLATALTDNDPLNKVDPLGLRPQGDDVFGGGMVRGSSAYVAGFPEPNCVWDVFPWCPGYTGTDPAEAAYLIWRTSTEVAGGAQARLSRISSGTTSPGNDAMGGVLAAWSVMRGGDASLLQCRWSDALLPVKCIFNDRVATTFDQPGYARGHTIFCYYDEGRCESEGVIDHELVHVNQYDRYGDSAFVLFEAEIKRHGYWCSKYEMEAFGDDGQSRCDASRGGG